MAIQAVFTGNLVISEDGVTLINRVIAETSVDLDDYTHRLRVSVATGATETIELPATDGRILAVFLRSGVATLTVGDASTIPLHAFLIMESTGFTSLSVTASADAEVEILVGGTD